MGLGAAIGREKAIRARRGLAALSGVVALLAAAQTAHAADLDGPAFADPGYAIAPAPLPPPPVPLPPPYISGPRVVVTSPLSVGGAYIPIPGLNGPTGPSAYPILPFAFGYGY